MAWLIAAVLWLGEGRVRERVGIPRDWGFVGWVLKWSDEEYLSEETIDLVSLVWEGWTTHAAWRHYSIGTRLPVIWSVQ